MLVFVVFVELPPFVVLFVVAVFLVVLGARVCGGVCGSVVYDGAM